MRRSGLTVALLSIASVAAAEWNPVVTGANLTGYVDPNSIRKLEGSTRMRVLVDYKKPPFDGNNLPYLSTLMLMEYDCKGRQYRSLDTTSFSGHMATGSKPYTTDEPGAWKPISPLNIQHTLWTVACPSPTPASGETK